MNAAKQSLIPIMNGQYQRLCDIEAQWGIRLHEGDQRPRIEYFHDAVRALTSGSASLYDKHSRLSIEHLAYDLSQLRHAQSHPLGGRNAMNERAVGSELVPHESASALAQQRTPDRATRAELSQLYKDYTVLFAALFAEVADVNFHARIEEVDNAIASMALAEKILTQLADGKLTSQQAAAMLEQIESDELRERLQQAIGQRPIRHSEAGQLIASMKGLEAVMEQEKRVIETAHLHYATGRLAVYEGSKDTVKRLAAQGLNLAGKFVETALAHSTGRGSGQGI